MYCKECGTNVGDDAKFCSKCGTAMPHPSNIKHRSIDKKTPVLTAQPVFVPWVSIVSVLPIQIFMTIWASLFLGGFSSFGASAIGLNFPIWVTFAFFGVLAFFGIPVLSYISKKNTYRKTEYKFFSDRLEYTEGFWTLENKIIKYDKITETNMRKGVIQKKYGLGTIILSTPATGTQAGKSSSGIKITDIENTDEIYNKLLNLIG